MTTTFEPNKLQLYLPSSIALVLALISFVIVIITEVNSLGLSNLDPNNSITQIATSNGFTGTIKKHVGTLGVTVNGLLSGQKNGSIIKATNQDVTNTLITGFNPNVQSTSDKNITGTTSILEAIEKGCVLQQTVLGEKFVTIPQALGSNDTLYTFFQKAQGLLNLRKYIFSNLASYQLNANLLSVWSRSPNYGSTNLQAGYFIVGNVINTRSWFRIDNQGQAGISNYRFFINDGYLTLDFFQDGSSISKVQLDITLTIISETEIRIYMTITTAAASTVFQTAKQLTGILTYDPNIVTTIDLQCATPANNLLYFQFAACWVGFK
jgi:hypothetical protein